MSELKSCKCGEPSSKKWMGFDICEKCYSELLNEAQDRTRPTDEPTQKVLREPLFLTCDGKLPEEIIMNGVSYRKGGSNG